jgi:hypothetical protein
MILLLLLFAQQAPLITVTPQSSSTVGELRFMEAPANGTNYSGIKTAANMAANCVWEVSNLGIIPCNDGNQTIGTPSLRPSHVYSFAATLSGSPTALSITGSSSGAAIDITGTGGGRAYSWYALNTMLAGGNGYYVTPDGTTLNQVINTSRDAFFRDVFITGTCTGCSGLPVVDTTDLVFGNVDNTKRVRISAALLPTATTTTVQIPNNPGPLRMAAQNIDNSFTVGQTFTTLNSTGSAINTISIPSGGVTAFNLYATNALSTIGTVAVGPDIFSLVSVIDNAGNLSAYSNYGSNIGDSSKRYNNIWARFASFRTNGSSLALIQARDSGNNLTFSMGDGGGTGGEFTFYNGSLVEYFAALAGTVRYNGTAGLTANTTCPAGQAVKSINTAQGGVLSVTCAVP